MKPSDFFLDRRQFLGFLVPGALWLASGLSLCGRNPFNWLENAGAVRVGAFVLGSYMVGYVLQSAIFTCMDEAKRWREAKRARPLTLRRWLTEQRENSKREICKLRELVRLAIRGDMRAAELAELNDHQLGQFCKRYGAKDSSFFQNQFLEIEDEINFAQAIAPPLVTFALLTSIRLLFPGLPGLPHGVCIAGVIGLMLGSGFYLRWRFSYARLAEEEAWYRTFLLVWSARNTTSSWLMNKLSPWRYWKLKPKTKTR